VLRSLSKKILDKIFEQNAMPNHIFSLGDKNFEYYNGMYYF
jgi:hypothetical protein